MPKRFITILIAFLSILMLTGCRSKTSKPDLEVVPHDDNTLMLRFTATNAVISRGFDNRAALKYSEDGNVVRFRIGEAILPGAIFIGFTGTPLFKKDKQTSLEIFGGYIHSYKSDEGVRDGVILDLRYEARDIPQDITSQERIDAWFDAKTVGLTPRAKAKLKAHRGNLQKVFSSRLEKIANDIIFDFGTKARLMDGAGNAILVAGSVYAACKYYEIFQSKGFHKCAIISSYVPQPGDLRTDTVSDDEDTETFEKYATYLRSGSSPATKRPALPAR